jgi:O-methyltransferase involved in polyketide biosynthesis
VSLADALRAAGGFSPAKRSLFICEGLTYYLAPDAVRRLFADVAGISCAGSRFMFDFLQLSVLSGRKWSPGFGTLQLVSCCVFWGV